MGLRYLRRCEGRHVLTRLCHVGWAVLAGNTRVQDPHANFRNAFAGSSHSSNDVRPPTLLWPSPDLQFTRAVRNGDFQSAQRLRRVVKRELRAQQRQEPRPHAQDRWPARPVDLRYPIPARKHLILCCRDQGRDPRVRRDRRESLLPERLWSEGAEGADSVRRAECARKRHHCRTSFLVFERMGKMLTSGSSLVVYIDVRGIAREPGAREGGHTPPVRQQVLGVQLAHGQVSPAWPHHPSHPLRVYLPFLPPSHRLLVF